MHKFNSLALLLACSFYVPLALAADGSITISAPADGAKLSHSAMTTITYDVTPGPTGDHVHLYVDNGEASVIRKLKGNYSLDKLAAGKHEICIKVVTKSHTPTGIQQCIKVSVE